VIKGSLGKVEEQIVTLENPSDSAITLTTRITNPTNFEVIPENITIQPYD